jgi:hypothetical protein
MIEAEVAAKIGHPCRAVAGVMLWPKAGSDWTVGMVPNCCANPCLMQRGTWFERTWPHA